MSVEHVPVPGWEEPSAVERRTIIETTSTVAMVGVSANRARPSNFVATYLLGSSTDFDVYFVNPTADEILGRRCYSSLVDLPVVPDLVDVFRRLEDVPAVAADAAAIGAKVLWTQFDLWSPEAAQIALDAGMKVVMDRCLKVEHARFYGGLHVAGFNTGVVDSRRPSVSG